MQLTLEIGTGPDTGRKITLVSGQSCQLGRGTHADVTIYHDPRMAGVHFALKCDRQACMLRDLPGSGGTAVNGQRVSEAVLRDGDQILAGETTFLVRLRDSASQGTAEPAAAPQAPLPPGRPISAAEKTAGQALVQERALQYLRSQTEPLFALMDSARDLKVLLLLAESKEEHQSLYEGIQGETLAGVAPYLVHLPPQSPLLEALVRQGWGKSWGVYLTCSLPLAELRKHFRRFLTVKTEAGKHLYFRFYDPRVLRGFLPTCRREEVTEFFGCVTCFLIEDETAQALLRYGLSESGLMRKSIPLREQG
jgi:pSer/pThr/pTyr-binding forkhead associated (FHA) protein